MTSSFMRQEMEEIPAAVRRLLDEGGDELAAAGAALGAAKPVLIATIARGSSDHATSFLKYAIELVAGIPGGLHRALHCVVSGRELQLRGCAALAISQIGQEPRHRQHGALGAGPTAPSRWR